MLLTNDMCYNGKSKQKHNALQKNAVAKHNVLSELRTLCHMGPFLGKVNALVVFNGKLYGRFLIYAYTGNANIMSHN